MAQFSTDKISFVIPVYDEEAVLETLRARMDAVMERAGAICEVVLVNDGSRDGSLALMDQIAREDPRYVVVNLSRNFGHQVAVTAGIDHASGDAVITMDADLQDPPEVALEMIARWREGYHVVLARRIARSGESLLKRATAALFYRGLRRLSSVDLPLDVGDFRLLDRLVVDALGTMPEHDRYLRGMIPWVGFRTTAVSFHRDERAGGESKYPLKAMVRLAFNGILGFSDVPLRLALWAGMLISVLALGFGVYVFLAALVGGDTVHGWTSTVLILTLLGGIQLLMMGIMGLYVGRIHNEVKRRPLYFVNSQHGLMERGHSSGQRGAKRVPGGRAAGGGGAAQRRVADPDEVTA
jgi:glycosyltransferase involved in cell wall biosynthesis